MITTELNKTIGDAQEMLNKLSKELNKGPEKVGPFEVLRIPGRMEIMLLVYPKRGSSIVRLIVDENGLKTIREMCNMGLVEYSNQKGVPNLKSMDGVYMNIRKQIAIIHLHAPDNIRGYKPRNGNHCDLCCSNIIW